MNNTPQKRWRAIVTCTCLMLISFTSNAYTLHYDQYSGYVTDITALKIGGQHYDAHFTLSGNNQQWDTYAETTDAAAAVANALNESGSPWLQNTYGVGSDGNNSFTPSKKFLIFGYDENYAGVGTEVALVNTANIIDGSPYTPAYQLYNDGFTYPSEADLGSVVQFTVSAVPVPAAVWLFGSGLGLLGWLRRRG
jgi:hypothetical protein